MLSAFVFLCLVIIGGLLGYLFDVLKSQKKELLFLRHRIDQAGRVQGEETYGTRISQIELELVTFRTNFNSALAWLFLATIIQQKSAIIQWIDLRILFTFLGLHPKDFTLNGLQKISMNPTNMQGLIDVSSRVCRIVVTEQLGVLREEATDPQKAKMSWPDIFQDAIVPAMRFLEEGWGTFGTSQREILDHLTLPVIGEDFQAIKTLVLTIPDQKPQ